MMALQGIFQGEVFPYALYLTLGLFLLPPISKIMSDKIEIWNNKNVRRGTYVALILMTGLFMKNDKETKSQAKNTTKNEISSYQSYLDSVQKNIANFSEEKLASRKEKIDNLERTQTYKLLKDSSVVSSEFLPLFTAINYGVRGTNTDNGFSLTQTQANIIKKMPNGKDKLDFVVNSIILSTPNKGGFTKELIQIFNNYKQKYKLYGVPSRMYDKDGKNEEKITSSYDMSAIFYLIKPSNELLDKIYEAHKKGISKWLKENKNEKYMYEYLATKKGYMNYVKRVYPDSPYILKVDYEVTANQLYRAYDNNEISADNKYKGKKLAVTGRISDISEVLGSINVDLKTGDGIGWTKVSCTMKNRDDVARLRKGQKVTIIGTCTGLTLNISIDLDDCEIWKD